MAKQKMLVTLALWKNQQWDVRGTQSKVTHYVFMHLIGMLTFVIGPLLHYLLVSKSIDMHCCEFFTSIVWILLSKLNPSNLVIVISFCWSRTGNSLVGILCFL